jgi:Na+/melibiose symporter-like transporter
MGAVPGCVLILSTICLYFYPIGEKEAKEIQEELLELRYDEINLFFYLLFFEFRNLTSTGKNIPDDTSETNVDIDETYF